MPRVSPGDVIEPMQLTSLSHGLVRVPSSKPVHLQFRRFAGCPICNLHLREYSKGLEALKAAGIESVAFFHSTVEEMLPYQGSLPFPIVADPEKTHYRRFGVEASFVGMLHPRVALSFLQGAFTTKSNMMDGSGGHLGLPADFLIAPDGRVLAAHYGTHADDHWSLEDVLAASR